MILPADASLQNRQNNSLYNTIAQKPFLNVNKILLDSYVQEAQRRFTITKKSANRLFLMLSEKGALVFNYL
jgi:hypothetical protein